MSYRHIASGERYMISALPNQGCTKSEVGHGSGAKTMANAGVEYA
jgi:hypothetical protein